MGISELMIREQGQAACDRGIVLRRMQLYGFSLRDSYVAPISEINSILLVNIAIIHPHQVMSPG